MNARRARARVMPSETGSSVVRLSAPVAAGQPGRAAEALVCGHLSVARVYSSSARSAWAWIRLVSRIVIWPAVGSAM
ncbi:MAG: hypothetical protein M3022_15680 [Actinomycetota bacterium]|nr:hypothetical protein [Actinomycetota bacterium]